MAANPLTNIKILKNILTQRYKTLVPEIIAINDYISDYYKQDSPNKRIAFFMNNAETILSYRQINLLYKIFDKPKTYSEQLDDMFGEDAKPRIANKLYRDSIIDGEKIYKGYQMNGEMAIESDISKKITEIYDHSLSQVRVETGYIERCILETATFDKDDNLINVIAEIQTNYDAATRTFISDLDNEFSNTDMLINDFSSLCDYYYQLIIAKKFLKLSKTNEEIYIEIRDKAFALNKIISPEDNLTQALPTKEESKRDFEKIISKESAGEAEVSEYWADIISKMLNSKVVIKHDTKLETSYTTVVGFDSFLIYLQPKKEIEALAHLIHEAGHVECGFKGMQNFKGIENMFINLAEDIRINLAASSKYNGFIEGCNSYNSSAREKNNDMSEKSIRWINIFDKSCNKGENANYEEAKIFKIAQALGTTKIIEIPKNIYLQYLMRVKAYILTGTADPFAKFDKDNKENKENNDNENKPDANAGIKALVNILKENIKDKENTLLDSKSQDIIKKIKKHIKELEDNNYSENTKKDIIPGLKNIYSELKNMEYD